METKIKTIEVSNMKKVEIVVTLEVEVPQETDEYILLNKYEDIFKSILKNDLKMVTPF